MHLVQFEQTKTALGSDVTIGFVSAMAGSSAEVLLATIWRSIFEFELRFSRFIVDSELMRFNARAGQKVRISNDFRELLIASEYLSKKTHNLHNPFVLPALHRVGYIQSAVPGYEHDIQENYISRTVVTPSNLKIGKDWACIPPNTAIDMGGCGKGYLADKVASMLNRQDVVGYWVVLGGDVAMSGYDENGDPITVAVQNTNQVRKRWMVNTGGSTGSVATSGTLKRQQHKKMLGHHIIDPRTGRAADTDVVLATVYADKTVEADALATCAVILGTNKAMEFLRHTGAKAALIRYRNARGEICEQHFGESLFQLSNKVKEVMHA